MNTPVSPPLVSVASAAVLLAVFSSCGGDDKAPPASPAATTASNTGGGASAGATSSPTTAVPPSPTPTATPTVARPILSPEPAADPAIVAALEAFAVSEGAVLGGPCSSPSARAGDMCYRRVSEADGVVTAQVGYVDSDRIFEVVLQEQPDGSYTLVSSRELPGP